jgi:hypothetical protein
MTTILVKKKPIEDTTAFLKMNQPMNALHCTRTQTTAFEHCDLWSIRFNAKGKKFRIASE